jgi:hypothetical protein
MIAIVCIIIPLAFIAPQMALASDKQVIDTVGAVCTPKQLTLGDGNTTATVDAGVATYVGGNMYLGNPDSTWSSQSPEGSYAVEAEGLTVVKNDFYANLLKGFFTMGKVAFGAQYRPADGSIVLSVGGNAQTWNSIKAQGVGIDGQSNYQGQIGKEGPTIPTP